MQRLLRAFLREGTLRLAMIHQYLNSRRQKALYLPEQYLRV